MEKIREMIEMFKCERGSSLMGVVIAFGITGVMGAFVSRGIIQIKKGTVKVERSMGEDNVIMQIAGTVDCKETLERMELEDFGPTCPSNLVLRRVDLKGEVKNIKMDYATFALKAKCSISGNSKFLEIQMQSKLTDPKTGKVDPAFKTILGKNAMMCSDYFVERKCPPGQERIGSSGLDLVCSPVKMVDFRMEDPRESTYADDDMTTVLNGRSERKGEVNHGLCMISNFDHKHYHNSAIHMDKTSGGGATRWQTYSCRCRTDDNGNRSCSTCRREVASTHSHSVSIQMGMPGKQQPKEAGFDCGFYPRGHGKWGVHVSSMAAKSDSYRVECDLKCFDFVKFDKKRRLMAGN